MNIFKKLILFFSATSALALNYDYIKSSQTNDLPKMGNLTCSIIQRHPSNNNINTKVCTATILSNHQLAYDQRCLYKVNPRDITTNELSCLNGSYIRKIPNTNKYNQELAVLNLDKALPVVDLYIDKTSKYTDKKFEKCFVKSANKYINIKPLDSNTSISTQGSIKNNILNFSDIGAGVICVDKNKKETVVGALDKNFRITSIAEIEKIQQISNLSELLQSYEENINTKCNDTKLCLKNLSEQTEKLTGDMVGILRKLNQDFKNESTTTSLELKENIDNLELNFEKIRLECNKIAISLNMTNDDEIETGFLSSSMGTIENMGISAIELFNSDFLLNQFKDVEIIGENLSDQEIKKIFEDTKKKNPNASNIELIKKSTAAFTDKIIQRISSDMDITRVSDSKFLEFKKTTRKDLDKCLATSDSKDKILECSDKFAKTASVKLSEIELENQLEENFKKQFENVEDFLNLSISAKDTFYRCINKFFYKQNKVDNSNAAKGCVLQSMLTAFNKTKDITLRKYIIESGAKSHEIAPLLSKIEKASKSCNNYDIIYSTNSNTEQDLVRLSNLEPDDFKTYLFDCIEKLTISAGRIITQESVKNHPQIRELVKDSNEIDLIVESVATRLYDECIKVQKGTKDANQCRDLITAGTTLEVAKKEIIRTVNDLTAEFPALKQELLEKASQNLAKCSNNLEQKHLEALATSTEVPSQAQTTKCLKDTVLIIVKDITDATVKKTVAAEEIVKPYLNEVMSNSELAQIGTKVKNCFQAKLASANSIDDFTSRIDDVKKECQFNAEKEATSIIAPIILTKKLTEALEDELVAKKIATEYTSSKNGLIARMNNAKSKEELSAITTQITLDLTIKGANYLIPNLVKDMLKDYPQSTRDRITKSLTTSISNCILAINKSSTNQSEQIDQCINKSTKKGYEEISAQIIYKNIDDVLGTDQRVSDSLFSKSQERFKKCADKISTNQASNNYKGTINSCMIDEVANLSYEIPREAILLYAPAAGLDINDKQMREKLLEIENYYKQSPQKGTPPNKTGNFILDSHFIHMKCISNARAALKKVNEQDMEKVQSSYAKCTDNVEKNIKLGIAEIFARKHSSNTTNYMAMYNLGKTLIQLTSNEPDPGTKNQGSTDARVERKPLSETFSQMHLVGGKFKTACEMSPTKCLSIAQNSLNDITSYKNNNPKATGDQLFNRFIDSQVMDFVVISEISTSLNTQLKEGMKNYIDDKGLLLNAINEITTPTSIEALMATTEGKLAQTKITAAIKNNTIDDIMKDESFRKLFAQILTKNTSNDSFIDKLIYGLIQPIVKKEKETSNGVFGIFKNPKVSLGRLFGIVSGSDFDWNKIRNTTQGDKARKIFASEIFAPIVRGEDLEVKPSGNKKYKNKLEELTAQIEGLIVSGVKSL